MTKNRTKTKKDKTNIKFHKLYAAVYSHSNHAFKTPDYFIIGNSATIKIIQNGEIAGTQRRGSRDLSLFILWD